MGKRKGVMLATKYTDRRAKRWLKECDYIIGQPKLNGERLKWTGGALLTSEGNQSVAVPTILSELRECRSNEPLDGEGYVHGWSKQRISSVLRRTVNIHPDESEMEYWVYDVPIPDRSMTHRIERLHQFRGFGHIKVVKSFRLMSIAEIKEAANKLVLDGFEGLILRHPENTWVEKRSTLMMKLKPGYKESCLILQIKEGTGKYTGTMGSMVVLNSIGEVFTVGSFAVTDKRRHIIWRDKDMFTKGDCYATIRFTELTDRGVPPSGVFKKIAGRKEIT